MWFEEQSLILLDARCYSDQKGIGGNGFVHTLNSIGFSNKPSQHNTAPPTQQTNRQQKQTHRHSTLSAMREEKASASAFYRPGCGSWVCGFQNLWPLHILVPTFEAEKLKPLLQDCFKSYEDVSTICCLIVSHYMVRLMALFLQSQNDIDFRMHPWINRKFLGGNKTLYHDVPLLVMWVCLLEIVRVNKKCIWDCVRQHSTRTCLGSQNRQRRSSKCFSGAYHTPGPVIKHFILTGTLPGWSY